MDFDNTYSYAGKELEIADLIKRRRLQLLIHSCIYYELNDNIISDKKWSEWAIELAELQLKYPTISKTIVFADDFLDWDGSSGAFLPLTNEWVMQTAQHLLFIKSKSKTKSIKKSKERRKSLF